MQQSTNGCSDGWTPKILLSVSKGANIGFIIFSTGEVLHFGLMQTFVENFDGCLCFA